MRRKWRSGEEVVAAGPMARLHGVEGMRGVVIAIGVDPGAGKVWVEFGEFDCVLPVGELKEAP
ncbi:MAG: hypothetical protein ABFE07_28235 [Armatimonadia bacterium]